MPENATGFWRNRDIHYCCDCHRCIGAAKVVVWEFLDRHGCDLMGWAPADHDFGIDLGGWLAIIAASRGFY